MALRAKHYAFMEELLASPMVSDVELAKRLGVNNNTIGKWKKMPEFQEEYRRRLREKWEDAERAAMESMISLAREGDFKASKYILDSLGYAPKQKIEADVNRNINVIIEE